VRNFILGFLSASAIAGLLWWWHERPAPAAAQVTLAGPDGGASADKHRRHRTPAANGPSALHPGDLRPVSEGDDLAAPDVINMGESGGDKGELPQELVDARFHDKQGDILACVDRARPTPDAAVTGKVAIKFRIQRTGAVRGVRVEAPAILMKNGLYRCIRPIVSALRFPASGQSLVLSYPFQLD
jgi:hypothetical protein